jgi:1,4-dihydroxy-6-naphthoate synthase
VNHKIDTKGFTFKLHLEDVQTLNEWALQGKLPFSKISYGVWPLVKNNYTLLNAGGALGKGVGPMLIYKDQTKAANEKTATQNNGKPIIETMTVAIPGINTTAHLLFSLAFPQVKNKKFVVFNEIEDAVLSGKVDAGVIIHENRFTYEQKGLSKWMDLGTYFEETFNAPIPLGGIIARNNIPNTEVQLIDNLIKESVQYAFNHSYEILPEFVKCHSQEMSEQVMRQHIDLYVNDFSIDMGITGKTAIAQLEKVWDQLNGSN